MAQSKTIARPYAKAVFGRADTEKLQKSWQLFLHAAAAMAEDSSILKNIALPGFFEEMQNWLNQWLQKERRNGLTQEEINFLRLIDEHNRVSILPDVALFYEELLREKDNVCMVKVSSARPLKAAQKKTLEAKLKESVGRSVVLDVVEDASLVSGVIIEYDGKVIDQSLEGRINQFARSLNE